MGDGEDWIEALSRRPEIWEPGAPGLWTDPHIAGEMLKAHLDPATDAASRRPGTIDRTVDWLIQHLRLRRGSAVLDLGCGPGLYASRLDAAGLRVTGIDFSPSSIEYARAHDNRSTYVCGDYREIDYADAFDACLLIYGDFCVLDDVDRDHVLAGVLRALKPGGWFAFDVTTRHHRGKSMLTRTWTAHPQGGFWRANSYLLLSESYDYPDQDLAVNQYAVIEYGRVAIYRNWFHDYDADGITVVLERAGFDVEAIFADLQGTPVGGAEDWLGVIARRR